VYVYVIGCEFGYVFIFDKVKRIPYARFLIITLSRH
jgi:hypothetical protein